ncbi:MAG: transaldolase family protein [Thermoproteota archaeon]
MKIFIDTADIDEIREACSWGIVDGATTNPTLIKQAVDRRKGKISMEDYIKEVVKTVPGPVSLEVIALKADEMVEQARLLHRKFSPYGQVAIKIPINPSMGGDNLDFDGLKAIRRLSQERIPTNATLVMNPEQALLAAKAGATYVSPFAGRIDDYIRTMLRIGFKKEDYFNHCLLGKMVDEKLREELKNRKTSISELYNDDSLRQLFTMGQDNGVFSGVDLVRSIMAIYKNYDYKTQVIAASIRNARQVREVAELGVHIATLPFYVIKEMVQHPKTLEGIRKFTEDVVPPYEQIFRD